MEKSFLKSKTIWLNVLAIIAFLAIQMGATPDTLPAQTQTQLAELVAVVNIVLRFVTSDPISFLKRP